MPTFPPVDEQLAYIKKGSAEIVKESELGSKLGKSLASGKPLRIHPILAESYRSMIRFA